MIEDIYTVKSFAVLGDSLKTCYNCDYCRADDNINYSYHLLPSKINKLFKNLPIAVNLFYGDPILQLDNTINLLRDLDNDNHSGIVILVTKGKLVKLPKLNINLHIGITIGPDKISQDNFEHNLDMANKSGYKFSIEYRPICKDINDSDKFIEYVISKAKEYNTCVSYSGLQLPPKPLDQKYQPYDNRQFSGQKYIGKNIEDKIQYFAKLYNVPIFKKTSCLLSYMHNLDRDYNAHFLKPLGVGCKNCSNYNKCSIFDPIKLNMDLPFDYNIVKKDNYMCSFVRNGLCKIPNKECLQMKGYFLQPKLKTITRGDARIIKWITGCMIDNVEELIETPFISDFWSE